MDPQARAILDRWPRGTEPWALSSRMQAGAKSPEGSRHLARLRGVRPSGRGRACRRPDAGESRQDRRPASRLGTVRVVQRDGRRKPGRKRAVSPSRCLACRWCAAAAKGAGFRTDGAALAVAAFIDVDSRQTGSRPEEAHCRRARREPPSSAPDSAPLAQARPSPRLPAHGVPLSAHALPAAMSR